MKDLLSRDNALKLNMHGLTAQLIANGIDTLTASNLIKNSITDIAITTDYGSNRPDSQLSHSNNELNKQSMDELIDSVIHSMDKDKSTMAMYIQMTDDCSISKDTPWPIHIGNYTTSNFGFRFPLGSMSYNEATKILAVNVVMSGIPPLQAMQEKYKHNLFNKIEENMIELVANGNGDLNNGSDRSITAFEIDAIINSDKEHHEKSLLYKNALLAAIFDDEVFADFMYVTDVLLPDERTNTVLITKFNLPN